MSNRKLLPLAVIVLALAAGRAEAQGRSKGKDATSEAKPAAKPDLAKAGSGAKPAKAKIVITHDRAVDVTREVLVAKGYRVERVERVGATRVIYFYRGNRGRGRGRGPLMRMVVRPVGDGFEFDHAPSGVTVDIKVRLKL